MSSSAVSSAAAAAAAAASVVQRVMRIRHDWVPLALLDRVHAIEAAGYPDDEAATYERLKLRLTRAPEYFLGAYDDERGGELIGYVCGTLSHAPLVTDESMAEHHEDGHTLCIHSVCVHPTMQRRGIAARLLADYVGRMRAQRTNVTRMALVCKSHLERFYAAAGFVLVGPSAVVHGKDKWLDMIIECPRTTAHQHLIDAGTA